MKGSKVYSLNILQIRKGISTMKRHKNKHGGSSVICFSSSPPHSVQPLRKDHLNTLKTKSCP